MPVSRERQLRYQYLTEDIQTDPPCNMYFSDSLYFEYIEHCWYHRYSQEEVDNLYKGSLRNEWRFCRCLQAIQIFEAFRSGSPLRLLLLRSYQRGEIIAKEGAYCEYAFLIRKGIIRTSVLTPDGGEKTGNLQRKRSLHPVRPASSMMRRPLNSWKPWRTAKSSPSTSANSMICPKRISGS